MGKFIDNTPALKSPEPVELRCTYRATIEAAVRVADRPNWEEILEKLPKTYQMIKVGESADGLMHVKMTYEACSANANDLSRRLRASGLEFARGSSYRVRTCGCPSGTTRCMKRTTN